MIANYGYEDASGTYYIALDTGKCAVCADRPCLAACPAGVFELGLDDWDDEVVAVRGALCRRLQAVCSPCKGPGRGPDGTLPCQTACESRAIGHTW